MGSISVAIIFKAPEGFFKIGVWMKIAGSQKTKILEELSEFIEPNVNLFVGNLVKVAQAVCNKLYYEN